MSLFDNNITTQTQLEDFHNLLVRWYTDNFPIIFKYSQGDILKVEARCQIALKGVEDSFEHFDMYHPLLNVYYVVDETCFSSISLSIIYSRSKEDPLPSPDNLFLRLKLPVPSAI